jgi:hypothetical protein
MSSEIEHRVLLGRLLVELTQMEQSARTARQLVHDAVIKIDGNRMAAPPVAREMIFRVLRDDGDGLDRAAIISGVHRDYGLELAPNTATTTLLRMQGAGLVRKLGRYWFLT